MAHCGIYCKIFIIVCYGICFSTCYENNLRGEPGKGYKLEVKVGTPPQTFKVLLDTGSSNLAIAAAPFNVIDKYFNGNESTTLTDLNDDVKVRYTIGTWSGKLFSDMVFFPTLNSVPPVRCDLALIEKEEDFFIIGAGWQGILGIAYPALSSPDSEVLSWIDSLQKTNGDKTMAFSVTLCGPISSITTTLYGSFQILNNFMDKYDDLFTATILHNWFYEIVVTGISVAGVKIKLDCRIYNTDKTIVDSGTTNLRLPKVAFRKLVSVLNTTARKTGIIVGDDFWHPRKVSCWPQEQNWSGLPMISIDIASSATEYFTIGIPAKSYIRQIYDVSKSTDPKDEPEFCYKIGVEPLNQGSILGIVVLEGFQVIFNRTSRTVGFRKASCGPPVTVTGPFIANLTDESLIDKCAYPAVSHFSMLTIAAYIVGTLFTVSVLMSAFLFALWIKDKYLERIVPVSSVSLSETSLINKED